jgi:hypothetical protein
MTKAQNFTTHNTCAALIETNGTCLCGYINATRAQLEKVFGAPVEYDEQDGDGKVTTTWDIQFAEGTVATLYDWKRYEQGAPKDDEVIDWHIGGRGDGSVLLIHEAFRVALGLSAAPVARIGHRHFG